MYIYICMYIHMYVYIYVCICVYIYLYQRISKFVVGTKDDTKPFNLCMYM
jgi:hypothetical protein